MFAYDEGNERYFEKHVEAGKITRIWKLGKLFEYSETTEAGVTTQEEKHYLTTVAQLSYKPAQNGKAACSQWRYFHGDRLGSIETMTNAAGQVIERHGFDPFGKPRQANWLLDSTRDGMPASQKGLFSRISSRGFTGHDHIDSVGLIHMNGRAYDPELGRFLSVDPFMQAPLNAQSLNAYSYVMNNPLAGTDPTGYAADSPAPKEQPAPPSCDDECKRNKKAHERAQRQIDRNTRRGGVTDGAGVLAGNENGADSNNGISWQDVTDPVKIAELIAQVQAKQAFVIKDGETFFVVAVTGGIDNHATGLSSEFSINFAESLWEDVLSGTVRDRIYSAAKAELSILGGAGQISLAALAKLVPGGGKMRAMLLAHGLGNYAGGVGDLSDVIYGGDRDFNLTKDVYEQGASLLGYEPAAGEVAFYATDLAIGLTNALSPETQSTIIEIRGSTIPLVLEGSRQVPAIQAAPLPMAVNDVYGLLDTSSSAKSAYDEIKEKNE